MFLLADAIPEGLIINVGPKTENQDLYLDLPLLSSKSFVKVLALEASGDGIFRSGTVSDCFAVFDLLELLGLGPLLSRGGGQRIRVPP